MAEVRWIKIVTDVFNDEKIRFIETMPNGNEIIVIWFKLLCLAGKSNSGGLLMMTDRIAYTDDMLASIFNRDIKIIRCALSVFENIGMVEIIENKIYLTNWEKHQNAEKLETIREQTRVRVQKHREKAECNAKSVTRALQDRYGNATDKELDIELDKEKEIYKEKENDFPAPDGANTNKELGSSTVIGAEVENKDTSFIATTALSNEQKESPAGEKKETAKQQTDNGTKASTTSGNLGTVKKITEAETIDFFTKTWEMYPRKVNKVQALKTYGYKLNGMSKEEAKKIANKIYLTLKNQIEVWGSEGEHGREFEFMPHFSTWLNANFTDSNGKVRCR